jgi:hypothetical protein
MRKVILVVPDPGRKKTWMQLQQGTHYDWVLTHLPRHELNYLRGIEELNGLIFEAQPNENNQVPTDRVMVHINEVVRCPGPRYPKSKLNSDTQLLMWHTIYTSPDSDLRPCYMCFQTFSQIIFMSQENLQQAMRGFAAI